MMILLTLLTLIGVLMLPVFTSSAQQATGSPTPPLVQEASPTVTPILEIFPTSTPEFVETQQPPTLTPTLEGLCDTRGDLGDAPDYHIGRGDAFFGRKDYTHAIEAYSCAIELDPNYLPGYVNRGYAYAVQFNQPLALDDYNRALEIEPDSVAALNNRGMLYLSQGRFQQAIDDFDQVVALQPDAPDGYHNRAVVHASEGDYDLALADVEQALTLDPDFAPAYATRGAIYLAMASTDYIQYNDLTGHDANRQTGNSYTMLSLIDDDLTNDGFSSWLALLIPIREATP
ncbi:MAG TPA: tetratricopeptide repeat protein [Phototrophicaceae bacterium]|jgi:tetratricopeptide (TPR) repeat protein|nr:tetratricopeptide repeat protein [Phototrophicaceae bacterium]